jgi:hypothetical protein
MREVAFRAWLEKRFAPAVAASRFANCRTVEKAYGDLDTAIETDQIDVIIGELTFSTADEKAGRPNPSKIPIKGDIRTGLATLKAAVKLYAQFQQGKDDGGSSPEPGVDTVELQRIGLERDLQAALRARIDQLEAGLTIMDGGAERQVTSGFIDITAKDSAGAIVVIELKAGQAGAKAISQILAYMGDVAVEDAGEPVRGVIVASDFDHKAQAAARMVPDLRLFRYGIAFSFSEIAHP